MSSDSVTEHYILNNKELVKECTGNHPKTDTNAAGAPIWTYGAEFHPYNSFEIEINTKWINTNVVKTRHSIDTGVELDFILGHKENIRELLFNTQPTFPKWLVPVSTTRNSDAPNGKWKVYFQCQGSKDGCKSKIIVSGALADLNKEQTCIVDVDFTCFPCVHPAFKKYGWLESTQTKQRLSKLTGRQAQIHNISKLSQSNYWLQNNHVCKHISLI